jgi:hypothetical protein
VKIIRCLETKIPHINLTPFGALLAGEAGQHACIKIEVTDIELNTKTIYDSIHEAARTLNIARPAPKFLCILIGGFASFAIK